MPWNWRCARIHKVCGPDFDGIELTVRISWKRIWRIKFAINYILSLPTLTGEQLESVLGHITWVVMVRREALSPIHACYGFVRLHRHGSSPIWPSVHRELFWIRSILPLLYCRLDSQWFPRITATDACGGAEAGWASVDDLPPRILLAP